MKKIIMLVISILFCSLLVIGCDKKYIDTSEILDLVQSNYISIEIKDKIIEAGSKQQYLIDDFIPKLSRYTLKTYDKELSSEKLTKVNIIYKDGSEIILLDNKYIIISDVVYEIINGSIDLDRFYQFIE